MMTHEHVRERQVIHKQVGCQLWKGTRAEQNKQKLSGAICTYIALLLALGPNLGVCKTHWGAKLSQHAVRHCNKPYPLPNWFYLCWIEQNVPEKVQKNKKTNVMYQYLIILRGNPICDILSLKVRDLQQYPAAVRKGKIITDRPSQMGLAG